jgi:hypothetical protein
MKRLRWFVLLIILFVLLLMAAWQWAVGMRDLFTRVRVISAGISGPVPRPAGF